MLNSFVQPASVSTGLAVEGVQPVQGYAPYNQLTRLMPAFKLAEDGAKPEDEEKKEQGFELQQELDEYHDQQPEIFRLAINVSFREMIQYFLTPEHDKILDIRSRLRNERGLSNLTIFSPVGPVPQEFDFIREELYEFQMQLFKSPKGLHCHIIL
ncbi:hypothetical protein DYD21_01800 [Rhodohalobacter sp. SW132]|uniref:hypothetical protein n=1 Tax=Rhodohalobacter sp. SW132 TaxID=2293433 RepID=UPI000E28A1CE|nr:hypothetical protein [Rhodohalobacter sp. SW132]REL38709.1 hypothetical protein DYD21_01800 [Rhodohalobacter sp. SW132]